jgi:hypothetical protein
VECRPGELLVVAEGCCGLCAQSLRTLAHCSRVEAPTVAAWEEPAFAPSALRPLVPTATLLLSLSTEVEVDAEGRLSSSGTRPYRLHPEPQSSPLNTGMSQVTSPCHPQRPQLKRTTGYLMVRTSKRECIFKGTGSRLPFRSVHNQWQLEPEVCVAPRDNRKRQATSWRALWRRLCFIQAGEHVIRDVDRRRTPDDGSLAHDQRELFVGRNFGNHVVSHLGVLLVGLFLILLDLIV